MSLVSNLPSLGEAFSHFIDASRELGQVSFRLARHNVALGASAGYHAVSVGASAGYHAVSVGASAGYRAVSAGYHAVSVGCRFAGDNVMKVVHVATPCMHSVGRWACQHKAITGITIVVGTAAALAVYAASRRALGQPRTNLNGGRAENPRELAVETTAGGDASPSGRATPELREDTDAARSAR